MDFVDIALYFATWVGFAEMLSSLYYQPCIQDRFAYGWRLSNQPWPLFEASMYTRRRYDCSSSEHTIASFNTAFLEIPESLYL